MDDHKDEKYAGLRNVSEGFADAIEKFNRKFISILFKIFDLLLILRTRYI